MRIAYTLTLDQDQATFEYLEPENAEWASTESDSYAGVVTVDPELLAPRSGFFSPFQSSWRLFENYPAFQLDQERRLAVERSGLPAMKRLRIHFERGQWDLFDEEAARTFDRRADGDTPLERMYVLHDLAAMLLELFTFKASERRRRYAERIGLARESAPLLFEQFVDSAATGGLLLQLWQDIHDLHDEVVALQSEIGPILAIKYWKDVPSSLAEFAMPSRSFPSVRHLYITTYEIVARLSVLAIAVESMIVHKELALRTAKGGRLSIIPDFQGLKSSNKADHLIKYKSLAGLAELMDSKMRNGIGHAQSYWDSATDEVVCVDGRSGRVKVVLRVPYTDFCRSLVSLFSEVVASEVYLYVMLVARAGELGIPTPRTSGPVDGGMDTSMYYAAP